MGEFGCYPGWFEIIFGMFHMGPLDIVDRDIERVLGAFTLWFFPLRGDWVGVPQAQ